MDAKERDLPFGQIHRKMIRILRHFVKRELTDHIRPGAVADDTVGLQFHRSIIEEFGIIRQDLSYKGNAIVGFHRFDLHIHIHVSGAEQQLPRWSSDAAYAGHHRLIIGVEHQRCDKLPETGSALGLRHGGVEQ